MKTFGKVALIVLSVILGLVIVLCTCSVCFSGKIEEASAAQSEDINTSFICLMPNGYVTDKNTPNIKYYYSGYFKIQLRTSYKTNRYVLN